VQPHEEQVHSFRLSDSKWRFSHQHGTSRNCTTHNLKAQLQKQLEKAQQEFDRLLEMSLELDESTPFLDDKLRKLSGKIKILKANIAESTDGKGEDEEATKQLTAQDLLIKEYDDILTARIIEKVIVHSRQEIEIYFIGGYTQKIDLI